MELGSAHEFREAVRPASWGYRAYGSWREAERWPTPQSRTEHETDQVRPGWYCRSDTAGCTRDECRSCTWECGTCYRPKAPRCCRGWILLRPRDGLCGPVPCCI